MTSTETRHFKSGQLIFREGDSGDAMYEIKSGLVGIFASYGEPEEKKLTELTEDAMFGEMAVMERTHRSATAVALRDTEVLEYREEDLPAFIRSNPDKTLQLIQGLSRRLRELTQDYLHACETIDKASQVMEKPQEMDPDLEDQIEFFRQVYGMELSPEFFS